MWQPILLKMKIVIDDKVRFLGHVFEKKTETIFLPASKIDNIAVKDADALIIRTRTLCNETLLKHSKVKFIGTATIGFDHIDTEYCKQNNIFFTNAPGCNSGSVAQYIASALVTISQKLGFGLEGKTLGVIGAGNVGKKVIKVAKALKMNILVNDQPQFENGNNVFNNTSIQVIQQQADIITFHVPLTIDGKYKTLKMCNLDFLSKLKPSAVVINSSRGAVVDNNDLLKALKQKLIAAAVLDVWENEPNINIDLMNSCLLATPHIAGYSVDGKANASQQVVEKLSNFFNLGITPWKPDTSDYQGFSLNYNNLNPHDILKSYNINNDSEKLKNNPEKFEFFRGNYPIRREEL